MVDKAPEVPCLVPASAGFAVVRGPQCMRPGSDANGPVPVTTWGSDDAHAEDRRAGHLHCCPAHRYSTGIDRRPARPALVATVRQPLRGRRGCDTIPGAIGC